MVFPVVMYRCESWTIKKAELQRIDAFVLWCWRRLLRVLWATRGANQSILKEINLVYSLERLNLKLLYFSHLMQRANSSEMTVMLGKIEGKRRRGWQRMRWLDSITDLMDVNLSKLWDSEGQGSLVCHSPWGSQKSGHNLATEQQQAVMRRTLDKSQLRDILQNTWRVCLETVKVIKNKESLRNCDSQEELNETWNETQCGTLDEILE